MVAVGARSGGGLPAPFRKEGLIQRIAPFVAGGGLGLLLLTDGESVARPNLLLLALLACFAATLAVGFQPLSRLPHEVKSVPLVAYILLCVWPMPAAMPAFAGRVLGAALLCAALTAGLMAPWTRLPRWVQGLPPLAGLLGVLMFRLITPNPSLAFPLTALLLLWLALNHDRREVVIGAVIALLAFLAPPANGAPYHLAEGLLYGTLSLLISFRVHTLVDQAREYAMAVAAVDRVMRRIAAGRPDDARTAVCDAALELVGAASAVLFEPEGGRLLVVTASASGSSLPNLRLTLDGRAEDATGQTLGRAVRPYSAVDAFNNNRPVFHEEMTLPPRIAAMAVKTRSIASLSQPVVRDGRPVGVLAIAWPRRMRHLPQRIAQRVEMLAEEASVVLYQAAATKRLAEMAASDPLTGLPNRREFDRLLQTTPEGPYALLAIDLDDLKGINDAYGHEAGDAALRAAADVMPASLRRGDVIARIGGDEFGAVLHQASLEEAATVAERMRQAMHAVGLAQGALRISVGCAAAPAGTPARRTWALADRALYSAKEAGRDRVARADSADLGQASRRSADSWVAEIVGARAIESVFQPICHLGDRRVFAYEALARPAGSPSMGSVESLFAAAHRLGFDRDLDWLCRRSALHHAQGLPPRSLIFLNVGIASLLDPLHDVDQMLLLLQWTDREPHDLVLEITERDAVRDVGRLEEVMAEYRAAGFRFAVDDVGQGHSTLEVLAAAVPEFVKISSHFARNGAHPGPHSAIRAVVTFARATGAQVIAEGLESELNVDLMAELGVELGQGYLLGRPDSPRGLLAAAGGKAGRGLRVVG
ncbi:MAG TPA: EAL domain-containing protein [Candidatus Dormibacteraeota bacterium]|jgi:diguanylate cyclase (GGDEF)-like protein|nr:EAL domain-containing protein [Candidatus Dormibacteraeota bacterium]